MGRIHLGRQNLDELQTRKMKGLKRSRDREELDEVEATNGDLSSIDGLDEADEADEIDVDGLDADLDGGLKLSEAQLKRARLH